MPRKQSYVEVRLKNAKFFDRNVIRGTSAAHHDAMSRFGAYVRDTAKKSMRTARTRKTSRNTITVLVGPPGRQSFRRITATPSKPGRPPRSIKGQLKRFLIFEYSSFFKNVVIGPIWLPQAKGLRTKHPVPAMHEQKEASHAFVRRQIYNKVVSSIYPQRPYMAPAFDKNTKKLRRLYRNSIK